MGFRVHKVDQAIMVYKESLEMMDRQVLLADQEFLAWMVYLVKKENPVFLALEGLVKEEKKEKEVCLACLEYQESKE